MAETIAPWSEAELLLMARAAHGRWRFYVLLVVLLAVLAWLAVAGYWAFMPVGARVLSLAVAVFWLFVLVSKLRFLHALQADRTRMPEEYVGPVHLLPVTRMGLFAPLRYELRIGNRRAQLGPDVPDLASTSGLYRVRIAPRSRRLVSIEPVGEGLNKSTLDVQTRIESGTGPDPARERQSPGCLILEAPATTRVASEPVPRRHDESDQEPKPPDTAASLLTPRDQELLKALGKGWSDKQIARALGLTPATVRTYNSNLFKKLGLADREAAAAWFKARREADRDEAENSPTSP